jgi:hypothetical protein
VGHPAVFIPWSEITARTGGDWFLFSVELRFARVDGVPLRLSKHLAEQIAQEACPAFQWISDNLDDACGITG